MKCSLFLRASRVPRNGDLALGEQVLGLIDVGTGIGEFDALILCGLLHVRAAQNSLPDSPVERIVAGATRSNPFETNPELEHLATIRRSLRDEVTLVRVGKTRLKLLEASPRVG